MLESLPAMVGLATSALGLLKGATDIANDIKDLVEKPDIDTGATKQLVSDLLDRLIRLQAEQLALKGTVMDLQEEMRRVDRFEAEAARYALQRTELGALVYELQDSQANGQPPHCICATCYEKRIKSILQPVGHNTLGCTVCGGTFLRPDGRSGAAIASLETGWDILDPYGRR